MAARRRTILVFHDGATTRASSAWPSAAARTEGSTGLPRPGGGEPRALGQGQWALLRKLVDERKPATIAIDISQTHAFSDGLSVASGSSSRPRSARGRPDRARRRAWPSSTSRSAARDAAHVPAADARRPRAHRARLLERGHHARQDHHRGRGVVAAPAGERSRAWASGSRPPSACSGRGLRQPGLHRHGRPVGGGHRARRPPPHRLRRQGHGPRHRHPARGLRLQPGETDAPAGLRRALAEPNRLQDLLVERMRPGRTGNEVLAGHPGRHEGGGIDGRVYTHPIGDHGHGAGPLIGLWDRQAIPTVPKQGKTTSLGGPTGR